MEWSASSDAERVSPQYSTGSQQQNGPFIFALCDANRGTSRTLAQNVCEP